MNYDECTYAARLNGLHFWRGTINYPTAEITVYYPFQFSSSRCSINDTVSLCDSWKQIFLRLLGVWDRTI